MPGGCPKQQTVCSIEEHIKKHDSDKIFTAADFIQYTNRRYVSVILGRLVKQGILLKVGHGQYRRPL